MSVLDFNKVDGIAQKNGEKSTVLMLISDHLDWEQEYDHLLVLQEKINNYLDFIQSGQAQRGFSDAIERYEILLAFLHPITESCRKFINVVNQQLQDENIQLVLDEDEKENML